MVLMMITGWALIHLYVHEESNASLTCSTTTFGCSHGNFRVQMSLWESNLGSWRKTPHSSLVLCQRCFFRRSICWNWLLLEIYQLLLFQKTIIYLSSFWLTPSNHKTVPLYEDINIYFILPTIRLVYTSFWLQWFTNTSLISLWL